MLSAANSTLAQSQAADEAQAWQQLLDGRAIALMRHALAPGTGDPVNFSVDQCETQRNLSAEGRQQAQDIGNYLRTKGITQATVLSSEWCRCNETAQLLGIGNVSPAPMLNSFFQDRSTADSQTNQLRHAIEDWLGKPDAVRLLVTHQVNISALTGEYAGSGDILIVTITNGEVQTLFRVPG